MYIEKRKCLQDIAKLINYFKLIPNSGIDELLPELREKWIMAYNADDAVSVFQIVKMLTRIQYRTGRIVQVVQGWNEDKWSFILQTEKA